MKPQPSVIRCLPAAVLAALGLLDVTCSVGVAADALSGRQLRKNANGVLSILGLSVVPNETVSTLSVEAADGDKDFWAVQLGGAFTISDEVPLYLEGFIGVARYEPTYFFPDDADAGSVSPEWHTIAGTAGVGWDFRLADELVLRPIFNVSLGRVESNASVATNGPGGQTGEAVSFLKDGRLNAYGLGGSLMLDWQRYREDYEADIELRYTQIRLQTFGGTSEIAEGQADIMTLGLWSRLRVPTGWEAFGSPIRGVGELAGGAFLGDQADAIGSTLLVSLGAGFEFDTGKITWLPLERTRLMGRYLIGDDLTGFSFGIGVTF